MRIKLGALLLMLLLSGCDDSASVEKGFAGLGGEAATFTPVVPGRVFSFPADHGPHDGFRIEWWYVTANLKDDQGREFGVQWTLFRSALKAAPEVAGWANQTIWLGHAAVTSATVHHAAERYARGGVEQAGVSVQPFNGWIDDWRFSGQGAMGWRIFNSAPETSFSATNCGSRLRVRRCCKATRASARNPNRARRRTTTVSRFFRPAVRWRSTA